MRETLSMCKKIFLKGFYWIAIQVLLAILYLFVIKKWVVYKLNPTQENRTAYLQEKYRYKQVPRR